MQVPALPDSFTRKSLTAAGFEGWLTWDELRSGDFPVSSNPLCYVVWCDSGKAADFLGRSPGGRFKGKDPTVERSRLEAEWIKGAEVVYVGKADNGKRRLKAYARFGAGEPVAHWGGRFIWQLADSADLLVAWHELSWDEVAREYEKRLLEKFRALSDGRMPLANLTG